MTTIVLTQRVFPRNAVVSSVLVLAAAALTALAAQWQVQLPFTPVPITGQTFAVLLTGAALGAQLGAMGQVVYVAAGALGAPVFTDGAAGVDVVTGATGGYLLGFILAAAIVGRMAQRGQDRTFSTMFTAFLVGSAVIYTTGVIGLMAATGWPLTEAVAKGVVPFLLGDLVKAAAAGLLVPGVWKLLGTKGDR